MQTLNLVRALVSGGYRVTVCCYYENDAQIVFLFREAGAEVVLMGLERSHGLFDLILKLKALLQKNKPDIVHVQYMAPGFAPILAARLSGIRTIFATVHQPGRTHGFKAKVLLRAAALLCTTFFCVSLAAEKSWFGSSAVFDAMKYNKSRRKHFTIYNAIDVSIIAEGVRIIDQVAFKNKLGLDRRPIVGVVGRLREEKGQDVLIRAMAIVAKSVPEACLLIVGDGPNREKLQKLSYDLGLQNYMFWGGQIDPDDVIPYYAIMDAVAVPSRFEGFGLTAAEAMAAGLPVVASNVDGLSEVVKNEETGYLVPSENSDFLADRIIALLTDLDKAAVMGQAGRKRVEQYFSMENFSNVILAGYKNCRNS
jgi:glycosyltransferase involved in cell wall biosynthesis